WTRLQAQPGTEPAKLAAWLAPALTVAQNENAPGDAPVPCYVLLPLIQSVAADDGPLDEVLAATTGDTAFERLAQMVLRWAISAVQAGPVTPDVLDGRPVTEAELLRLLGSVLVSDDTDPLPIGPDDVDTFMNRHFRLQLQQPVGTPPAGATAFPMPPALALTSATDAPGIPALNYTFAGYNSLDDEAVAGL